ncbi:DNA repair protein UVH3 isoform X1 [Canna indica]|uniref:DNA repair protein UVH3 isoform X1 n=1 Tax=Canna indica TaxID=4628 RepID=A0AAQ3KDX1_9LILI|nr:DNA repair protein UVH3 isoform X1 [Canna indica]
MGVQGLWELLAPVGRRVSVETLAGKKLAVDASIWLVQFMKAMRDDKGEMVRNAHLIGFFRRICKLLFLRAKPVFVFDGATPALKRRTVAARRRHRDNARAKIRKTAEKLLVNHLKTKRLEELAEEIKKQKEGSKEKQIKDNHAKGKMVLDSGCGTGDEGSIVQPDGDKGFGVTVQEDIDKLLAASLAAEEYMDTSTNLLAPSEDNLVKDGSDDDENEEMVFPIDDIQIDPAVLASLPPSMQLDLLVQMRERVMAENRQKYQKIKKVPTKFSELQIQSYLKTIAFRREIDEVQKSAAGRGIAGVQTSRIASEANREFIFSSSFTGDKQLLTSRAVGTGENQDNHASTKPSTSTSTNRNLLTSQPNLLKEVSVGESVKDFGPDVETYHDEKGRLRVSRVRGLGIRMTRDLQRNLDLMEEYEQEKKKGNNCEDPEASCTTKGVDILENVSENVHPSSAFVSSEGKNETVSGQQIVHGSKAVIEISFSEDDNGINDMDDDDNIFMQLVSGGQTPNLPLETNLDKSTNDSESDCLWTDGLVEDFNGSPKELSKEIAGTPRSEYKEKKPSLTESIFEEVGMEWEDSVCNDPLASSNCQGEPAKHISRGFLEEEAEMQEAIRRSLEDFKQHISSTTSVDKDLEGYIKDQSSDKAIFDKLITINVHLDNDSMRSLPHTDRQMDSKSGDLQIADCVGSTDLSGLHLDRDSSPINEKEDEVTTMLPVTDNTLSGKHSDGQTRLLEQSLDGSNEIQTISFSRMSMEEFCGVSSTTNLKTTNDGSKSFNGDCNHDDFHVSKSNLSSGRGHDNTFSENGSLLEEIVVDTGTDKQQVIEETNITSIPIGYHNKESSFNYPTEISEASLDKEISLLRQERSDLGDQQRMLERNAESVSNEMFADCQELLQMFGLPYIIAPTEAEAQCAYMEMAKLVDGVVTDDSDVFLFGARSVFKNIFDDRKYVETYFMKDIDSELGLDREKLIRMALLLGSDYTEGVSGIGIVNAIEVVHAFPEEDGLQKFREWIESPDPTILGKIETGSNSKRKSLKETNAAADAMNNSVKGDASEATVSRVYGNENSTSNEVIKDIFMNKHRNVSKNWHIPPSFPNESVIDAYMSPQVDESTETFAWGKPDLPLLRKLCWEKFGWTNQKADELLVPVLKEYNKHETQLRLEAFYTFNERFAKIRSQRIKQALKGITGTLSSELADDLVKDGPISNKEPSSEKVYEPENSTGDNSKKGKKVLKQSRGRNTKKGIKHSEDVAGDSHISRSGDIDDNSVLSVKQTGKGRRGKGRERGRGRGKGRGRKSSPIKSDSEHTDGSGNDYYNVDAQMENHSEVSKTISSLRRSMRPLKHVQYAEEDFGADQEYGTPKLGDSVLQEIATAQEPVENDGRQRIEDSADVEKGEYLFSGGGFCADENDLQDDESELVANPIQDSTETHYGDRYGTPGGDGSQESLEDGISRDYLFSGGGFCMDEDKEQVHATQPASSQMKSSELSSVLDISEDPQTSVLDDTKRSSEPLRDSSLLVENSRSHQDGQTSLGLRAMSSLRRKRRRT